MYKSLVIIVIISCLLIQAFAINPPLRRAGYYPHRGEELSDEALNLNSDSGLDLPHGAVRPQPHSVTPIIPAREVDDPEDLGVRDLHRAVRPFQLRDPVPLVTDENRPIGVQPNLPRAHITPVDAGEPIETPIETPVPVQPGKPTVVKLDPVVLPKEAPTAPDDKSGDDKEQTPVQPINEMKKKDEEVKEEDKSESTKDKTSDHDTEQQQHHDDDDDGDDDDEEESTSSSSEEPSSSWDSADQEGEEGEAEDEDEEVRPTPPHPLAQDKPLKPAVEAQ